MTTLHSGGKFGGKVYDTSGGLHGVGSSVVNALSDWMEVEVARDKRGHTMRFERGNPITKLKDIGAVNRRGTAVSFHPDAQIFGKDTHFSAARLYRMVKSKAYLFRGVEIRWKCDPSLIKGETPAEDILKFPGGLSDFLASEIGNNRTVTQRTFSGRTENRDGKGAVEWAAVWTPQIDPFVHSYCNTIPTSQGGTHEQGLRNALTKSLRTYGESNRKISLVTADDVMSGACAVLSVFIRDPEFQGQTKDKLSSPDAQRLVENVVKDHFDHWLAENPQEANKLLEFVIDQAEDRLKKRPGKGNRAKIRDAQAPPARQACRLLARRPRRHGDFPRRRRQCRWLRQTGA
ncbi:MAG: hypothetical protein WDM89_20975 [Rhizomicrobium sp.]